LIALAGSLVAEPQQRPTFQASTDTVVIDVAVRAGDVPVKGLTMADFEVIDNGSAQTLDHFTAEVFPLDLTLLIDRGRYPAAVLDQIKSAVNATTDLLEGDDNARILKFTTTINEAFDGSPAGIPSALEQVQSAQRPADLPPEIAALITGPISVGSSSMKIPAASTKSGQLAAGGKSDEAGGGTALYDAIVASLARKRTPERRALVVAFTMGIDTHSTISPDILQEVAKRSDTVLDVFLTYPPDGSAASRPEQFDPFVRTAAEVTGGFMDQILGDEHVTDRLRTAMTDFKARYLLSYTLKNTPRPGWHDVTVRVKGHNDYKVLARKGYDGGK
jgi:VWFA-related protein